MRRSPAVLFIGGVALACAHHGTPLDLRLDPLWGIDRPIQPSITGVADGIRVIGTAEASQSQCELAGQATRRGSTIEVSVVATSWGPTNAICRQVYELLVYVPAGRYNVVLRQGQVAVDGSNDVLWHQRWSDRVQVRE